MKTKEEIEIKLKEFEDKKDFITDIIKNKDPRMQEYVHLLAPVEMRIQTLRWVLEIKDYQ